MSYATTSSVAPWSHLARYVAIIADGNGRWARYRRLLINHGHEASAGTLKTRLVCPLVGRCSGCPGLRDAAAFLAEVWA